LGDAGAILHIVAELRYRELRGRGVTGPLANKTASSSQSPWPISASNALPVALPNAFFDSLGLQALYI
jgi:hypothetical protein